MSDNPIGLEQALTDYMKGTQAPEQADHEADTQEDQTTQEAADPSELEDGTEEHPEDQDSEEADPGETDDEDTDETEEEEEQTFTLSIGGKEETVTLSELQNGYLREADYTRKTQAIAEQRKHLEGQAEQVTKQRDEAVAVIGAVSEKLLGTPPAKPDISLARSDPATYEEQKYAWEQWHALKAGFDGWRDQLVQEREKESQAKRAEIAKAEGQKFLEAFKEEVKDEASFTAKIGEIQSGLNSFYGYNPQELAGMIDHRAYLVAADALKYRALMAENKPKAELKVKKAKLKPATSSSAQRKPKQSSARDQARNRFIEATNRTGHNVSVKSQIDSAVDAYLEGQKASR